MSGRQDPASEGKRSRRSFVKSGAVFGSAAAALLLGSRGARAHWFHHHHHHGGRGGSNCLLEGSKIQTPKGPVEIERLCAGDLVVTKDGGAKPIRAVHTWQVSRLAGAKWPEQVAPVLVARSAIAENVPSRDLYMTPNHSLYVDGQLVAVRALVNGMTIKSCRDYPASTLRYFHLELDAHEIMSVEGAPVESMLCEGMAPYATATVDGRRKTIIASRARSAVSSLFDRRSKFDHLRERLDARAHMRRAS
jgi:hypothetical protein